MLTRDHVLQARETIGDRLPRTPLLSSRTLGARLKCELFQRTGSFKSRGALNRLNAFTPEERERGAITISAGNHAQGVAYAARELGVDALVVMWQGASPMKLAATRGYGATVDLEAANPTEAFDRVHELVEQTGRVLIHPHEDPLVLAGHGTVALEIEEDAPDADAILVAVGGGGLISGVQAAVGDRMRVIAVEPERSQALHKGIEAGAPVNTETASIADGLNAPRCGRLPIELCRDLERVLVTEDEIKNAFRFLYERAKLAVEPAGAVATAALLARKVSGERPVVIVSGGNVSTEITSGILDCR